VHRGYRSFVVDLTDCDLMDSTFMGTLAGIALRLREIGQGSLVVVGANDRNRMLLENLGLDQLFRVCKPGDPETPELPSDADLSPASKPAASEEEARITALTAHEALVEVDPENEAKFRDVLEYLKQQPSAPDSES
jgi:anti-sigma B factor antagonist